MKNEVLIIGAIALGLYLYTKSKAATTPAGNTVGGALSNALFGAPAGSGVAGQAGLLSSGVTAAGSFLTNLTKSPAASAGNSIKPITLGNSSSLAATNANWTNADSNFSGSST